MALDPDELRATVREFERRRSRVVAAILPAAIVSALGVLFLRDSVGFLIGWPLMLFVLGAYVHRVFRCPRCERPIRGRPRGGMRCTNCGAPLELPSSG